MQTMMLISILKLEYRRKERDIRGSRERGDEISTLRRLSSKVLNAKTSAPRSRIAPPNSKAAMLPRQGAAMDPKPSALGVNDPAESPGSYSRPL